MSEQDRKIWMNNIENFLDEIILKASMIDRAPKLNPLIKKDILEKAGLAKKFLKKLE